MIFFGHLGITLAAAGAVETTLIPRSRGIDYRVVLSGSLLPDIIDKSIIFFISGEKFSSGRMFAHSFLFSLLLFVLGMVVLQVYRKSWVLVLSACCFFHQLLDVMWKQLNTFLWPLYNSLLLQSIQTSAPDLPDMPVNAAEVIKGDMSWSAVRKLFSDPYIYISELAGVLFLSAFFIILVRRKQVINFLRTGKIRNRGNNGK